MWLNMTVYHAWKWEVPYAFCLLISSGIYLNPPSPFNYVSEAVGDTVLRLFPAVLPKRRVGELEQLCENPVSCGDHHNQVRKEKGARPSPLCGSKLLLCNLSLNLGCIKICKA